MGAQKEVGEVTVVISADTTEFKRELHRAQMALERFNRVRYLAPTWLRRLRGCVSDWFWVVLGVGGILGVAISLTLLWKLYTLVADVQIQIVTK